MSLALLCVVAASATALAVFALYPAWLWAIGLFHRPRAAASVEHLPRVSLIVVARNAEALIREKIENSLALDYPPERLSLVLVSDGSTDRTAAILEAHASERIQARVLASHLGKAEGLNAAASCASGEILVFSDADAVLEPAAVRALVARFADEEVGGVCGQRVLAREGAQLRDAQRSYVGLDSRIKALESRISSISSNDGKLYAIRRELFEPIEAGVTDDLSSCLTVVEKGFRFVFEPRARAVIRVPSRTPSHEVLRRRRIVSRSLRGIHSKRRLLNPFRFGVFSVSLFVNKVLRRLVPVLLLLLLVSSSLLAALEPIATLLVVPQLAGYLVALAHPLTARLLPAGSLAGKLSSAAFYFGVGSYGTLLGCLDFVRGRTVTRWDPQKVDGSSGEVGSGR